jgi:hypothetical protein
MTKPRSAFSRYALLFGSGSVFQRIRAATWIDSFKSWTLQRRHGRFRQTSFRCDNEFVVADAAMRRIEVEFASTKQLGVAR